MLNELAKELYTNAVMKGIYDKYYDVINLISDKQNLSEDRGKYSYVDVLEICKKILLIQTELSESVNALQTKNFIDKGYKPDILETDDFMFKGLFNQIYKNKFEVELIDTLLRLLELMGELNIDIDKLVAIVMRNNSLRDYKDKEFN